MDVLSLNSVLVVTTALLLGWLAVRDKLNYWAKRGVPYVSPWTCLTGTLGFLFKTQAMYESFVAQYDALEGHPYGGTFQLLNPSVMLRDPAMIKEWLIKGFTNFHDRGPEPDEKLDKLSGNLFQLTGDKWRLVRQKLSPIFSTAKLRIMYQTLKGCAEELNAHLQARCQATGETELDVKDLVSNYTMDVIGACAMGIKCNAIQDPENCTMKKIVKRMFRFNWRLSLFQFLEMANPRLPRLLGLSPRDKEVEGYLEEITKEAIRMKQQDTTGTRKDFLQLLMKYSEEEGAESANGEAQSKEIANGDAQSREIAIGNAQSKEIANGDAKSKEIANGDAKAMEHEDPVITENVIMGVIASFLSAGLEPVSATVTFCAYELAHHPEVQEKLFKEIQAVRKESGGEIKYDDLKKLHYLDQVVNETLRKYPIAPILGRKCTEAFQIPDSKLVLEKGINLMISTMSLHHDPKYFPEPEKFDPERFSEENVNKIIPGTYLPFGDGPRFCIAMRLALMDVKTMIITLVSDYTLHTCPKTVKRIEIDRHLFTLAPKGQVRLRLKKRS
ncbi:unnamed protein product [Bemisia tabaci]|uniref:Cytochrome P450 n=1 Tax=Bemisia tabaci TaxID=7038 RepID=A0A9P0CDM2_BEMTA|nr:unnamed protein product [Bemisia tabaci]